MNINKISNIVIMAKPINQVLKIKTNKVDDFLNEKSNKEMWNIIKQKSKIFRKNMIK